MRVKLPLMVVACFVGSVLLSPLVFAQGGGRANVPVPPAPPAAPQAPTGPTAPAPPAPAAAAAPQVSFKVDFVLTRFQGDKKLSSLPYSILVASGRNSATLRSGSQIPVPAGKETNNVTPYTYQTVGVSITVSSILALSDGRYAVQLNFDDSSVMDSNAPGASTLGPVIRSNSFSSSILVREGQPLQFSVATDKVSGETLKAELTLTVLK